MDRMQGMVKPDFTFPGLLGPEMGEIERVAAYVGEPAETFVPKFLQATLPRYERSEFIELDEKLWSQLKNTDSVDVVKGDWEAVKRACEGKRDWQKIKKRNGVGWPHRGTHNREATERTSPSERKYSANVREGSRNCSESADCGPL